MSEKGGTSWLGRSAPRLYGATLARASKIMAPTSCFTGQVHRLPDAPEAYGAMITRAKAAPSQSRSPDLYFRFRDFPCGRRLSESK
jgi:hypothetical protein